MFDCNRCGKCCTNLDKNPLYTFLNRGDGTCIHFNEVDRGCNIYDQRPAVCNVDMGYDLFFKDEMTRESYYELNKEACKSLE